MKNYLLAVGVILVFLFTSISTIFGAIPVPVSSMVANLDSGCCTWASLETAGNILGISSLSGLTRSRNRQARERIQWSDGIYRPRADSGGNPERIREELSRRHVSFEMKDVKDEAILQKAIDASLPVVLSLHGYPLLSSGSPDPNAYHAVLLVGLSATQVTIVDSNDLSKLHHFSRGWLKKYWTGRSVVLQKPKAYLRVAHLSKPPDRSSPRPLFEDEGPPRSSSWVLLLPPNHQARSVLLAQAIHKGKNSCFQCLQHDFQLSSQEAVNTINRIWKAP